MNVMILFFASYQIQFHVLRLASDRRETIFPVMTDHMAVMESWYRPVFDRSREQVPTLYNRDLWSG